MRDIVLLYEGTQLYAGGSPKAAHMRTDKMSEIRTCHLSVIKPSLIIFFVGACHLSTWTERDSLPYITSPPSTSHISGGMGNKYPGCWLLRGRCEKHP